MFESERARPQTVRTDISNHVVGSVIYSLGRIFQTQYISDLITNILCAQN